MLGIGSFFFNWKHGHFWNEKIVRAQFDLYLPHIKYKTNFASTNVFIKNIVTPHVVVQTQVVVFLWQG